MWLLMRLRQQDREIAELRARVNRPAPQWAQEMQLDHRAQLVSLAALVQLAARDNLDALIRLSPEMASETIRELAPHLFQKDGIR